MAGFDCPTIAAQTYHPERYKRIDAYGWAVHIGPGCTREHDVRWFHAARSQADCLRMAFGPSWHIYFLNQMGQTPPPNAAPEREPGTEPGAGAMQFYLLTHSQTGWRLLVRLPVARDGDEWASLPDTPRGRLCTVTPDESAPDDDNAAATAREVAHARRTWVADSLTRNVLVGASMYDLMTEVERYSRKATPAEALAQARMRTSRLTDPPPPAWAWNEQVGTDLRAVLTEVWMAEKGLKGQDAEAMRVMCALAGWQAIHAYASDSSTATLDARPVA